MVRVLRQGSIIAFGSSEESSFLKMPVESEMLIVVNKRALGDVASTETTGSVLLDTYTFLNTFSKIRHCWVLLGSVFFSIDSFADL